MWWLGWCNTQSSFALRRITDERKSPTQRRHQVVAISWSCTNLTPIDTLISYCHWCCAMKNYLCYVVLSVLLLYPLMSRADGGSQLIGRATVIDGDTIEIRGQRVRLWGVDAPESSQTCTLPDGRKWRCGAQSANELASFIGVRNVTCVPQGRRSFDRIVARCSVAAIDIGGWLVENGWALDYSRFSGGHYARQQAAAAGASRGMHASTFVPPWEHRGTQRAARP